LAFSRDDNNDDKMTVTMMPTPTPMPTPMPIPPIRTMPPMPMPAASSLPMPMSMPPMPPMQHRVRGERSQLNAATCNSEVDLQYILLRNNTVDDKTKR